MAFSSKAKNFLLPFSDSKLLVIGLAVLFTLIAAWSRPFLYEDGNSGRYLLGVLQAADPELFPNDTVVQELKAFDSLFYKALAMTVGWLSIAPEQVKNLLFICYVFYLFLLFLTLYALTNCITKNKWLFILISIWVIQPTHLPLGGGNLFEPILRHTEVAFLFGLWTIYGLLQKRYLLMWSCLAVALLVHALVGLHLLFFIGPVWFFFHHSFHWKQIAGLILFGLARVRGFDVILDHCQHRIDVVQHIMIPEAIPQPSPGGGCRYSPKRGFDKHVLSTVEGLSLSGCRFDFKGVFPLTLNYYRRISARRAQIPPSLRDCR
jgi:hypothetical protein